MRPAAAHAVARLLALATTICLFRREDAAHCEILRKHPEQYRNLVRSFTQHCLHAHTPPETWI